MFIKKVKYRLLLVCLNALFALGFEKLLLRYNSGYRILIFHGIDLEYNTRFNSRFVSVQFFEELLKRLSKHCVFISLEDLYQKKFVPGKFHIALTFDDGLKNNFDLALPILKKYKAPATFFVCPATSTDKVLWPDFLDLVSSISVQKEIVFENQRYTLDREFRNGDSTLKNTCKELEWKSISSIFSIFEQEWQEIKGKGLEVYWQLMQKEHLKEIITDPLFSIGAHTVNHPSLTVLPEHDARMEMAESKQILDEMLGQKVDAFAFPFGSYNEALLKMAEELGFTKVLLMDKTEPTHNELCAERMSINPHISVNAQIYFILKGKYL